MGYPYNYAQKRKLMKDKADIGKIKEYIEDTRKELDTSELKMETHLIAYSNFYYRVKQLLGEGV